MAMADIGNTFKFTSCLYTRLHRQMTTKSNSNTLSCSLMFSMNTWLHKWQCSDAEMNCIVCNIFYDCDTMKRDFAYKNFTLICHLCSTSLDHRLYARHLYIYTFTCACMCACACISLFILLWNMTLEDLREPERAEIECNTPAFSLR
jgi:hypothetical protein